MPAVWNWPLEVPIAMKVSAKAFDWPPTDAQVLPNTVVEGEIVGMIRRSEIQ